MREISSFTRLAEPGQQNQLGAHPRAIGLDPAALDTAHTLAAPALSVLPSTHETVLLAGSGTSVLTTMTSTKAHQRRPLENQRLRQRPGLARLHPAAQFKPTALSPKHCCPKLAARSASKADTSLTRRGWVDRCEQTDCSPEGQKQKARG